MPYIVYTYTERERARRKRKRQTQHQASLPKWNSSGVGRERVQARELFGPQNAGTCESAGALRERAVKRESEAQQNKNSCRATAVLTARRYSFKLLAVRFVFSHARNVQSLSNCLLV